MVETIISAWVVSGAIGSILIAIWWTDELPLTTEELPGLIFGALLLGPLNLVVGLFFVASLAVKRIARWLLPNGSRVIFRQWGR